MEAREKLRPGASRKPVRPASLEFLVAAGFGVRLPHGASGTASTRLECFALDYRFRYLPKKRFRQPEERRGRTRLLMVIAGNVLLAVVLLYLMAGVAVGLRFAITEATAFSERAAVGSFPFRMLLIPGAALLWPLILRAGSTGVTARPLHGTAWGEGRPGRSAVKPAQANDPAATGGEGTRR